MDQGEDKVRRIIAKGINELKLGHYKEALQTYGRALAISPKNTSALLGKGVVLCHLNQFKEALEVFNEAMEINPDDVRYLRFQGVALFHLKRDEEALVAFDKILAKNPNDINALRSKNQILRGLKRYEESILVIDRVLEIDPNDASSWKLKGCTLCVLNRDEEALEAFDKALGIDSTDEHSWKFKGLTLGILGRYDEALQAFNKALEINPENADYWQFKGALLYDLGRDEEALMAVDKSLEISPNSRLSWETRGHALYMLRRYKESLEAFDRAVENRGIDAINGINLNSQRDTFETYIKKPKEIPMSTRRSWTIAIRPGPNHVVRKVTKIISLGGNGFSVLTPYHKAQSGYLFKMPVPAGGEGKFFARWKETVGFTVESHVKLSYHTDGFVQFSSEKQGEVISGRDPVTGEPKGLGLLTNPLTAPIWSGASVGVTIWGLDDFEEIEESDDDALVFGEQHFYYRACSPEDANGWILELYAFPSGVVPPVRWQDGHFMLDVAMEPLNTPLVSVKRLSVLYLPEEKVFLGLALNRTIVDFPSVSGWILNGPGDHTRRHKGHVLMACYPRDAIPVQGRPSLDRR